MKAEEFLNRLDIIIANLDQWILESLREIAPDAFAEVVDRIHKEGVPGKSYSDNPLPAYYFSEEDALNAGGRNLLKKHTKKATRKLQKFQGEKLRKDTRTDTMRDGISYKEWREANGLQTAVVDLSFTANMFRSMKDIDAYMTSGRNYVVEIYSTRLETNKKLQHNFQRYGSFLALNETEKKAYVERFGKILKRKMDSVWL